jgi:hypothetical protein
MTEWTDPDAAEATMRAARLEPLEPFDGADRPWRCRCLACGRIVTPRLSGIAAGVGCKYCATKGLDLNAPATVSVLTHPDLHAHLIGFDEAGGAATDVLVKDGWQVVKSASVPTLEDAYEITAAVLRWLRLQRGLPACLPPAQARPGAMDGSVAADAIDAADVWAEASSELSRRRRRRRAAGGARGGS